LSATQSALVGGGDTELLAPFFHRGGAPDERSIQPGDKTRGQGLSARMALKDLSLGEYVLRVEASAPPSGHSAHREVPFEVK